MTALPNMGQKGSRKAKSGDLLRGGAWAPPEAIADPDLRAGRGRRGIVALNRSPLARKIIIFNLMALVVLVAGVLFMNPFSDSLVQHREQGLVSEAKLIANVVEAGRGDGADLDRRSTIITNFLNSIWDTVSGVLTTEGPAAVVITGETLA